MKRQLLIKHLTANNCVLLREGKKHSLYKNTSNGKFTAVPRHPDIQEITVKKDLPTIGYSNIKDKLINPKFFTKPQTAYRDRTDFLTY